MVRVPGGVGGWGLHTIKVLGFSKCFGHFPPPRFNSLTCSLFHAASSTFLRGNITGSPDAAKSPGDLSPPEPKLTPPPKKNNHLDSPADQRALLASRSRSCSPLVSPSNTRGGSSNIPLMSFAALVLLPLLNPGLVLTRVQIFHPPARFMSVKPGGCRICSAGTPSALLTLRTVLVGRKNGL